jgi:hypothetical protein
MNTYKNLAAAAVLVAATFVAASSFTQDRDQTRTPPRPAPSQGAQPAQPRQPQPAQPAQPPRTSQPSRRPPQTTTPQHGIPRPPQSTRPMARPPVRPQVYPTYIYPYWPLFDLDFYYQFPYGTYPYYRYGYPYPPYYYPVPPVPGEGSDIDVEAAGSVRIDIPQKDATIYVDGFYVGMVADFDGDNEQLNLTLGPHHLEIRAPGYQTTLFDVNIQSGKTITYRTSLLPSS